MWMFRCGKKNKQSSRLREAPRLTADALDRDLDTHMSQPVVGITIDPEENQAKNAPPATRTVWQCVPTLFDGAHFREHEIRSEDVQRLIANGYSASSYKDGLVWYVKEERA